MDEQTRIRCEQFIENRDKIKSAFGWDGGLTHLACAGICLTKGKDIEEKQLTFCKELIKEKVGRLSNFKSMVRSPIATIMAVSENPEQTLDRGLLVYEILKQEFRRSIYLPMAAMTIAQLVPPTRYEAVIVRTRILYSRIKEEHPFLTSSEDCIFCVLLALSDKGDEELLQDIEECYQIVNSQFFFSNAVQSLSYVLALFPGAPECKCKRTVELYERLKAAGYKYGTNYELPTLGVLAMSGRDLDQLAEEVGELDQWLSKQKGFGRLGGISGKQRLMYAGSLAQKRNIDGEILQATAVNSALSFIVAQEVAICAAIAASTAAATNQAAGR